MLAGLLPGWWEMPAPSRGQVLGCVERAAHMCAAHPDTPTGEENLVSPDAGASRTGVPSDVQTQRRALPEQFMFSCQRTAFFPREGDIYSPP